MREKLQELSLICPTKFSVTLTSSPSLPLERSALENPRTRHNFAEERQKPYLLEMLRNILSKVRQSHSVEGRLGTMSPKKQTDGVVLEGTTLKADANPAAVVAYSRPPPLPPVVGPVVAFSLLDAWLKRDSNDD